MLIHSVYFWLQSNLSEDETKEFKMALNGLLKIGSLREGFIGVPAETRRPVIDSTYSFALILTFDDNVGQEAYQVDPIHLAFVEKNKQRWTKVVVYDANMS